MRVILHVDIDSFFVQCEILQRPELAGKPVVIQQHQDIISISPEAKRMGVVKHMKPSIARQNFPKVQFVHVPTTPDGKATYKLYQDVSDSIFTLISSAFPFPFEKASIDEFYMDATQHCLTAIEVGTDSMNDALNVGTSNRATLAQKIRETLVTKLNLVCSVGVASNKLLAKMTSRAAKPNGLKLLMPYEVLDFLHEVSVTLLPGCGGQLGNKLIDNKIKTIGNLSGLSIVQLENLTGNHRLASYLFHSARGENDDAVADRGHPKTIRSQMSLTASSLPSFHGGDLHPVSYSDLNQIKMYVGTLAHDILRRLSDAQLPRTLSFACRFDERGLITRSVAFPVLSSVTAKDSVSLLVQAAMRLYLRILAFAKTQEGTITHVTRLCLTATNFDAEQTNKAVDARYDIRVAFGTKSSNMLPASPSHNIDPEQQIRLSENDSTQSLKMSVLSACQLQSFCSDEINLSFGDPDEILMTEET